MQAIKSPFYGAVFMFVLVFLSVYFVNFTFYHEKRKYFRPAGQQAKA